MAEHRRCFGDMDTKDQRIWTGGVLRTLMERPSEDCLPRRRSRRFRTASPQRVGRCLRRAIERPVTQKFVKKMITFGEWILF